MWNTEVFHALPVNITGVSGPTNSEWIRRSEFVSEFAAEASLCPERLDQADCGFEQGLANIGRIGQRHESVRGDIEYRFHMRDYTGVPDQVINR